jgi:hypothetical protein
LSGHDPGERDWASRLIRARGAVLCILALATLAIGSQAPSIGVHFAPEELVAPDDRARADADRVREHFGNPGEAVVLLVEGEDVLDAPTLAYLHRTARALSSLPVITRVVAPSTVPVPRRVAIETHDEEDLDALEDGPIEGSDALDPALAALADIVAAHPARWPDGMLSLANETSRVEVAPLVAGETPTEAERLALIETFEGSALLRRRLVSPSRHVAVVAALLRPGASETELDTVLDAARASIEQAPTSVTVRMTGLPVIRREMVDALRQDQLLLVGLATLASLVVLLIGLRTAAGVMLPLATVGVTVTLTLGGMAIAGEPINLLTNMIPPLLLTIGLAEAVHMVLRWEEEVARGSSRTAAAASALRHLWLPSFVTTFTTAIGFGALLLQETSVLRRFGLIAALATMLAYVITVVFVPSMLPFMRPRGSARRLPGSGKEDDLLEQLMVKIARATLSQWRLTLLGSLVLLVVAAVIAQDIVVDSRLLDQFAEGSEVAVTTRILESELDGVRSLDIVLDGGDGHFLTPEGLADLDALAHHLRDQSGVLRVESASDWLREMRALLLDTPAADDDARARAFHDEREVRALHRLAADGEDTPLARLATNDGSAARLEVRLEDRGASRILSMLAGVQHLAEARGLHASFSGEAYDASRGLDRIVRSLGSLGAAVALIFLVMTLLFRSVRLGLIAIPPNALPLALTLAYMVLRGIPLHAATVIVFTVTVGLSVDGATHVIARFQEEAKSGLSAHEIVLATVRSSGRGVVLSSATLLLGYGALLFSAFEPVRLFGELSAVAIAGSLIAQIVLLPALLAAFAIPARSTAAAIRIPPEPG